LSVINKKNLRETAAYIRIAYIAYRMSRVDFCRHCEGACPLGPATAAIFI